MTHKKADFDLFTFVAEHGIKKGGPFPIHCNCGAVITIMPPFQEESVICPCCESSIKIMVVEGDPGYVFGWNENGPMLIPVQGSSKEALELTPEERETLLRKMKEKRCNEG